MTLFKLIKNLSKAEKRHFKLSSQSSKTENAKYVKLYDILDQMESYDQSIVLSKMKEGSKSQLNNLKKHLQQQILNSLVSLKANTDTSAHIRIMIEQSNLLLDKSMVDDAISLLNKAKKLALNYYYYSLALDVVEKLKTIELVYIGKNTMDNNTSLDEQASFLISKINTVITLSNISTQLSSLNFRLGYARSAKDMKIISAYFKSKLDIINNSCFDFLENLHYYHCLAWYSLIRYDFVHTHRWLRKSMQLFDSNPTMKTIYHEHYIRGIAKSLEIMFMTRQLNPLKKTIAKLHSEQNEILPRTARVNSHVELTLILAILNMHMLEGSFVEGTQLESRVEQFLQQSENRIDEHYLMMVNYKMACIFFGANDYRGCKRCLARVIAVKNDRYRRDLHVFSRILNLIASYEIGDDETLEYQIKSVYSYVVKINDMRAVQHAIITFLKRLPYIGAGEFNSELKKLHQELEPLEVHPYERRPFFYLDIISWLESKITGVDIGVIRRRKYPPSR